MWNRAQMRRRLRTRRLRDSSGHPLGPYTLQAAIAVEHAKALRYSDTDWRAIAALYGRLFEVRPTPVVELNRAVAIAMAHGTQAGLSEIARLKTKHELDSYYLLWSAEADLFAGSAAALKRNKPIAMRSNSSRRTPSADFSNGEFRSCSSSSFVFPAIAVRHRQFRRSRGYFR